MRKKWIPPYQKTIKYVFLGSLLCSVVMALASGDSSEKTLQSAPKAELNCASNVSEQCSVQNKTAPSSLQSQKVETKQSTVIDSGKVRQKTIVYSSHDLRAKKALARVQKNIRQLQANFEQNYVSGMDAIQSKGIMYIEKPGKFRWEPDGDKKEFFLADGQHFYIGDREMNQALKHDLKMQSNIPQGFSFMFDDQDIGQSFDVKWRKDTSSHMHVQLIPKAQEAQIKHIDVTIFKSKKQPYIDSLDIVDNFGSNKMTFSDVKINKSIAKKTFTLKDIDKNVKVVEDTPVQF